MAFDRVLLVFTTVYAGTRSSISSLSGWHNEANRLKTLKTWSGRGESNPRIKLGKFGLSCEIRTYAPMAVILIR